MSQERELEESETRRVAAALLELRPHVGSPEAVTERVDAQRAGERRVGAADFRHRLPMSSHHFARAMA